MASRPVEIDRTYTSDDHLAREEDPYAAAKYRITLEWMRRFGVPAGARVLNVGAGSGVFSELAQSRGYLVTNVEPDPEAAAIAEARLGPKTVVRAGVFDYEPEASFDVAVMHDVLEHIEEDHAAVDRIYRFLGAGSHPALLIASVPAWQWLFGYHDRQLGHFRRYSPRDFRRTLQTRFDVLRERQLGVLGIPAAFWYSRLKQQPYPVGSGGMGEAVFSASMRAEERLELPLGSSTMCAAKPSNPSPQVSPQA